jgi:hypothetical protein
MRRRRVAVIANSLASTDGAQVHFKYGRYCKPQLPAGVRLQASASFRARPEVRFVHNGDVHLRKLPCLRRETLGRLEAGAVTSCGLFHLQRSLDETDAIVTEQACSEVRNLVRMRRESELLASCRIQERRLRKRSP